MTRKEAIQFLVKYPYKFGHMVGFTKLTEMHNGWMRKMLSGEGDYTLQGHRESYKTTCLSIVLTIIIILHPNFRTLFCRKTDGDVKEIIEQVRKVLMMPQTRYFVQVIYGVNLKLLTDNALEISTNLVTDTRGTSQLVGTGIGGSLTGKHFERIFTDDIVNVKDRKSKAEREQTKLSYQELVNLLNRGGRLINTGTPWHPEDAFVLMPKPEKWDCYSTGLMSKEDIERKRQSMAPSLFAANYELQHIAAENALFTTPPTFTDDASLLRDGIAHIDAAYGGEDYTALTCGKRVGDKLYMYGRMWQRHVDEKLDECIAEAKRLMCEPILNEDNGDKGYLSKEIKRRSARPMPYHEKENKYIKISSYLRKWWPNIVWLEGTDKEYLNQIMDYTEDAEHDDACLAGDTMIATAWGDKPIREIVPGEYVITPAGLRKVTFAGITGFKEVQEYHGVISTRDHKFYDRGTGEFIQAQKMTNGYEELSLKELIHWKARLLSSTEKPISEIRRADIISSARQEMQSAGVQRNSTVLYGNTIMGRFQQAIIYIMLMAISTITTFPIWSVYRLTSIFRFMLRKIRRIPCMLRDKRKTSKKRDKLPNNGTRAMQGASGINSTLQSPSEKCGTIGRTSNASFAGIPSKDCRGQNTAVQAAWGKRVGRGENKEPVYNLTVEKAGCYYANGILVSNCDSASCIARYYDAKRGTPYQSPFFKR